MADKFQDKYRISSARLKGWNYTRSAAYFVTICTRNREMLFGNIKDGKMEATAIGNIAEQEWMKTPEVRPDMNLMLGQFVAMPNHFHGIMLIGDNEYNGGALDGRNAIHCRDAMHRDSTGGKPNTGVFGPQSKNLASIMRGFKSSVTTHARKMGDALFNWQTRYHDHIIRDADEYERIEPI
ncbi:MAG: hypothetical protein LH478_15730 [Chitinophagaceae bacterium]|nr:hypothetical protein [Chitinophagaceae bacterium]